jgi:hypothetical protein
MAMDTTNDSSESEQSEPEPELTIRGSWYRDGSDYVVVVTGQPERSVEIGVGRTVADAWRNRQTAPMQSVGRDCGEAAALRWAHGAGWCSAPRPSVSSDDFEILRSDLGDGGWSLHYQGEDDESASGESEKGEDGEWERPNADDYADAIEAYLANGTWLEPADDEAANDVSEPVGDVDWGDEYAYVMCVYGSEGDEPGDCRVRVGEDELGLWWIEDGDDAVDCDMRGPYNTEELAKEAAEEWASEQNEALAGEDADDMRDRLLAERAGEPDADGEWCVYWETALDDEHVVARYATRDAAEAAAEKSNTELARSNPGPLLCSYGVRVLEDDEWVAIDDERY